MIFKDPEKCAEEIAPIFKKMKWEWAVEYWHIPNKNDILQCLLTLIQDIECNENCEYLATGHLFAKRIKDTREIICGLEDESYYKYLRRDE